MPGMKLKQNPEDFRVEELTGAAAENSGEFAFYRLDKIGWTTPDALAAIRRRWRIDYRRMSYGGLKDRHAVTSQYLTILRGPKRDLKHERIALTYLGRRSEPFTAGDILANRFTIVLRGMSEVGVAQAGGALAEVEAAGVPNYFDDQRFGSVGENREFVAKEMVFGNFERALWLALAAPYEFDRAEAKREKALLRERWGDWPQLKARLPRGHARSLVDYLVHHPTDHKGAVARLRPDLQGLYLSAYQSYLWNHMLAEWLRRSFPAGDLTEVELKLGRVPAPTCADEKRRAEWESLDLPLPSARLKPDPAAPWLSIVEEVLSGEGLTLAELRIKGLQKPFFSKGDRAACVRPANLSREAAADELNMGKRKLSLRFDLPRGAYATMLVKRVAGDRTG
jgi:tRNA pseudouridine13 synthase